MYSTGEVKRKRVGRCGISGKEAPETVAGVWASLGRRWLGRRKRRISDGARGELDSVWEERSAYSCEMTDTDKTIANMVP